MDASAPTCEPRSIVVHGRVDGNLYGIKSVDLKKSAVLVGDFCTPRIAIEEGPSLKGSVLVQKDIPTLQRKKADHGRLEIARALDSNPASRLCHKHLISERSEDGLPIIAPQPHTGSEWIGILERGTRQFAQR